MCHIIRYICCRSNGRLVNRIEKDKFVRMLRKRWLKRKEKYTDEEKKLWGELRQLVKTGEKPYLAKVLRAWENDGFEKDTDDLTYAEKQVARKLYKKWWKHHWNKKKKSGRISTLDKQMRIRKRNWMRKSIQEKANEIDRITKQYKRASEIIIKFVKNNATVISGKPLFYSLALLGFMESRKDKDIIDSECGKRMFDEDAIGSCFHHMCENIDVGYNACTKSFSEKEVSSICGNKPDYTIIRTYTEKKDKNHANVVVYVISSVRLLLLRNKKADALEYFNKKIDNKIKQLHVCIGNMEKQIMTIHGINNIMDTNYSCINNIRFVPILSIGTDAATYEFLANCYSKRIFTVLVVMTRFPYLYLGTVR